MFLGMLYDDIKNKKDLSAIFKAIKKKEVLGYFPNDFLATRGHPWGNFAPLKKIAVGNFSLKKPFPYKQVPNSKL